MKFKLRSSVLLLLLLVSLLLSSGCSNLPQKATAPAVVKEAAIPKLSAELRKEPLPSGAYWQRVTQWRKVWEETLRTLPPRSED
jgi:hypothetical protein